MDRFRREREERAVKFIRKENIAESLYECVCVCVVLKKKKKKRKVKLADWRSQQRERKVGFDWRFGIRGTVLIGPWGCYVTVKWGGDFDDFFKVFWVNLKLPERQCGKFEMTFVSWNRWLETFLVFFFSKYSGFACRSLAGLASQLPPKPIFVYLHVELPIIFFSHLRNYYWDKL